MKYLFTYKIFESESYLDIDLIKDMVDTDVDNFISGPTYECEFRSVYYCSYSKSDHPDTNNPSHRGIYNNKPMRIYKTYITEFKDSIEKNGNGYIKKGIAVYLKDTFGSIGWQKPIMCEMFSGLNKNRFNDYGITYNLFFSEEMNKYFILFYKK